jgi:glutamine amidotransferase-like uncharacterized protein
MITVAIFVADPRCSVQSANGIMQSLGNKFRYKIFSKNLVEDNFFDGVDLIAVPGGFGDADSFDTLFKHNLERVREFVQLGGRYLGICMGAYWAGQHYLDILDNVNAVQYIQQPGTCTRRPHAKNMPTMWYGKHYQDMFFYDGPTFVGAGQYQTVATYANTGMPMAIKQNNIGLIGCHPESQQFWYDGYSWMRGKYHNGQHHKILLDFVEQLMLSSSK